MAGLHAAAAARGATPRPFPRQTALGSLCHYITGADPANYQPANITFDLLPHLDDETKQRFRKDKKARHAEVCRRAQAALDTWMA
jgi:methylenetetrahydrofolate--tRNA-(uracil-5-)-methyltransferase